MSLIRKLFGLCTHKWVQVQEDEVWRADKAGIIAREYVQRCEHCMKMRKYRM